MVEMPGIEPGSNVYKEGSYDHVLLDSLHPSEENGERGRGLTLQSGNRHVSRCPTSLVTPSSSSEDQEVDVSAEARTYANANAGCGISLATSASPASAALRNAVVAFVVCSSGCRVPLQTRIETQAMQNHAVESLSSPVMRKSFTMSIAV
jgi:hypothetical protein